MRLHLHDAPSARSHFGHSDFQFAFEGLLGAAYRGASDVGEVLATASRIEDGDADSWLREWTATAGTAWAAGKAAAAAGHRISALGCFRRAASYYAAALYLISHTSEPDRQADIWRRQRDCWDHAVDLFPVPGERVAIAYEDTTLPGYFFRAPDAGPGEIRPLVILNNGSDGATSQMWVHGGAAAGERGYHWMTFDGPGQQAALMQQDLPFRPDWEAVLTPVVDAMVARADVDARRLAVIGVSQGGYWVPRALAFEHRCAAAAVDPGVVDVSSTWMESLPGPLRSEFTQGKKVQFDRNMHIGQLLSPATRATLAFRGAPYGLNGGSSYDLYKKVSAYQLGDEVTQITTPILITDPESEQFWPGQSQRLYDLLRGPKELVAFRAEEGADSHCEPLAPALRESRIFDWLDGYLT
jgi:hypothetical protein